MQIPYPECIFCARVKVLRILQSVVQGSQQDPHQDEHKESTRYLNTIPVALFIVHFEI